MPFIYDNLIHTDTHVGSTKSSKLDLRNKSQKQILAHRILSILSYFWSVCFHQPSFFSGTEQYSRYSGYAESYKWVQHHEDKTPRYRS